MIKSGDKAILEGQLKSKFPNMDYIKNKYLVLPVHLKVKISDAKYICRLINKYI